MSSDGSAADVSAIEFAVGLGLRALTAGFLRISRLAAERRFFDSEFTDGVFAPFFSVSLVFVLLGTG
jgi:hypothetical protein